MMNMGVIQAFIFSVTLFIICGVLGFVPFTNFLNSYLENNAKPLPYKVGILWGAATGVLWFFMMYYYIL